MRPSDTDPEATNDMIVFSVVGHAQSDGDSYGEIPESPYEIT